MSTPLRLDDYPTTPLYNIKAVVQATGISPSTLRAWERRYQMCQPQRSESGYRLYSERDIVVIRWLKTQVDAGMAISQAVSWYENIIEEAGDEGIVLPTPMTGAGTGLNPGQSFVGQAARQANTPGQAALASRPGALLQARTVQNPARQPDKSLDVVSSIDREVRNFAALQADLLQALINFDEESAEYSISEAFSLYSVEAVGENVFLPVLVEIGERWHRGEIGVTTEHFASNYLRQRLGALTRSLPSHNTGALIWVGCAPGEMHEVGAILVALYLKRAGCRVRYLGQNVPGDDLIEEARRYAPAMILLSAASPQTAQDLISLSARLESLSPQPIIGYGGQAFNTHQDLRNRINGTFMGATAEEGSLKVQEILGVRPIVGSN